MTSYLCMGRVALDHCCKWSLLIHYACTVLCCYHCIDVSLVCYQKWVYRLLNSMNHNRHLVLRGETSISLVKQQFQQRHLAKNTASKLHFVNTCVNCWHSHYIIYIFITFYIRHMHNLCYNLSLYNILWHKLYTCTCCILNYVCLSHTLHPTKQWSRMNKS